MNTVNTFSLSNLTDADLSRLLVECGLEQARREERRTVERQKWVDDYYRAFLNSPHATTTQVGDVTIVAFYTRNFGVRIGTARPVHGDVFNRDVGLAVAFAKAIGATIPEFI